MSTVPFAPGTVVKSCSRLWRVDAQAAEWLRGIDDISPGSFDLLTVTILFPG